MTLTPTGRRINASAQKSFCSSEALRFLALLGKDPAKARFRFFPHKHNPNKDQIGPRKLVGLDAKRITRYQQEGRGAYIAIGHSDGRGDTKANIVTVPALFVEWDDKTIEWQLEAWRELGLPEPSIQVATGGASVHTYWLLTSPLPRAEWEPLQQRLIKLCGSDSSCDDASRVMRLPGCDYIGPDGTPIGQTTIISATGKRYALEEILAALPAEAPAPAPPPAPVTRALAPSPAARCQGKLPPREETAILDALAKIPEFHHDENRREELLGLALRLWVEVGKNRAHELLAAHSPTITDLPGYFATEPTQISTGSFWPFVRDQYGVDIRRHDLKPARTGEPRRPHERVQEVEHKLPADFAGLIHSLPDGWQRSEDGPPRKTALSVGHFADLLPTDQLRFNQLELMAEVHTATGWQVIRQQDMDSASVLLDQKGWKIGSETTTRAIVHVAHQNRHHPVRHYLLNLEKRQDLQPFLLDEVAPRFLRADGELHRTMVRKWLIGAVARALQPGCKMDYCLTLKGRQGILKSGFFEALASREWHSSTAPDQDKDFLLNVQACWLFELAELESHTSKRDAGRLKNIITTARDRFRPPYGKSPEPFDRQSVFCSTVNADEFFRDETGNRRFWVVPVDGAEKIDTAAVKAARDGIWLAALHAYRAGELPMLPDHLAVESEVQNVQFREEDPWEAPLIHWLETGPGRFTTAEALTQAGLKAKDQLTRGDENRAAVILRKLGCSKGSQQRENGKQVRKWHQGVSQPSQRVTTSNERGCDTPEALQQKGSQLLSQPSQPFLKEKRGVCFEEERVEQRGLQKEITAFKLKKGCDGCDTPQKSLESTAATGLEVSQPPVTTSQPLKRGCDTPPLPSPLPSTSTAWVELALDCLHLPPASQYLEAVMGWLASVPEAPAIARTAAADALARLREQEAA